MITKLKAFELFKSFPNDLTSLHDKSRARRRKFPLSFSALSEEKQNLAFSSFSLYLQIMANSEELFLVYRRARGFHHFVGMVSGFVHIKTEKISRFSLLIFPRPPFPRFSGIAATRGDVFLVFGFRFFFSGDFRLQP